MTLEELVNEIISNLESLAQVENHTSVGDEVFLRIKDTFTISIREGEPRKTKQG